MARRRKAEEHANHERWLVSYADFITLLFAFFVVMFASAQADHGKAARVSESVRKALEEGQVKAAVAAILGGTKDNKGKGNAMMMGPGGAQPTRPGERRLPRRIWPVPWSPLRSRAEAGDRKGPDRRSTWSSADW